MPKVKDRGTHHVPFPSASPGARAICFLVPPSRCKPRVLVVEDDYFLAEDLSAALGETGAEVLGPVPDLESALSLLDRGPAPTAAILDIKLGRAWVYPLADALRERGIPFVFATGYEASAIPAAYAAVPRCEKPYGAEQCLRLLFGQSAAADGDQGLRAPAMES